MRNVTFGVLMSVMLCGLSNAQDRPLPQAGVTTSGIVVSSTPSTLVVKSADDTYQLFTFYKDTVKPKQITLGSTVRVISLPGEEPAGARVATNVTVISPATTTSEQAAQPMPENVKKMESDIKRQVRKFHAGFRTGVTLDPELLMIGAHIQMGPIFSSNLFFRPNMEFAWGEVSTMFSINPEVIYRLPVTARAGKWSSYVGFGPGFNFVNQSFESGEDRFSHFHTAVGLNLLGGLQNRSGLFVELKASVYSEPAPTLRLILGYNF